MHDGRFKTLEEVVEHYNSGVQDHKYLSWQLKDFERDALGNVIKEAPRRLNLTALEKQSLIAFLKTLTDWDYVKDVRYGDPFLSE